MYSKIENLLKKNQSVGILILRLFIGLLLIYGVFDNVISQKRMTEFSEYLTNRNFPFPTVCAFVSVYAQFICGILITVGYKTRLAAVVLVINFLVAIVTVHLGDTIEAMTPALTMLFSNSALIFTGAGKYSFDKE
ncbi:DoxX family protein [Ferruginibacter sp.]|nr:DoxX family protein [Ferruginibacter sp.]